MALELLGGTARSVAVGDSLQLIVRAVTAAGDTVPGAAIRWDVLDTGVVAFALDETRGLIVGVQPGRGRVQASYEHLLTDPVTITVVAVLPSPGRLAAPADRWIERQTARPPRRR